MTKHTLGPLVADVRFQERHGGRTYVPILRLGNDPVPVAIVHLDVDGYGRDVGLAYARVFTAAPDMLAALKDVVRVADWATVEFDAARAAIARAEGST